jgi:hypothetical protein
MPDTLSTSVTAERGSRVQNTAALATEFVVVSFWQPKSGSGDGHYHHETFADQREAESLHADYERGEWAKARAVCVFASRHGVPIGRVA